MIRTACLVFACFLGALCLRGVARTLLAWRAGKPKKARYFLCRTLVLTWSLCTFVVFIVLHLARQSYAYFTLACVVPAYCNPPLDKMRRSMADDEW